MTETELSKYWGKNITVITTDENIIKGYCCIFTRAVDNEPEEASVSVEVESSIIEIYLNEIQSVAITD